MFKMSSIPLSNSSIGAKHPCFIIADQLLDFFQPVNYRLIFGFIIGFFPNIMAELLFERFYPNPNRRRSGIVS